MTSLNSKKEKKKIESKGSNFFFCNRERNVCGHSNKQESLSIPYSGTCRRIVFDGDWAGILWKKNKKKNSSFCSTMCVTIRMQVI